VTSVNDVQSARVARVATGCRRLAIVVRNASASVCAAVFLGGFVPAVFVCFFDAATAASQSPDSGTAAAQATTTRVARVARRMPDNLPQTLGHRQSSGCVVTERALMRAVLIAFYLSSAFLAVGCKQGNGDRCVQNSDCSSGICVGASVQGGHCAASITIGTGTGGSSGAAGQGGGEGGAGAADADSGATAPDGASTDAASDAAGG
jgi:hypothetical protein